jgi:F-type H+-transporting ATPase subunit b
MPQLDPTFFATQLFWLAISFTVLYVLMSRVAMPQVASVLKQRDDKIQGDLETAQKLKEETKSVIAAYEKALADARGEAQALARQTTDAANAESARQQQEVADRIASELAAAELRIGEARAAAMANVKTMATEVALSAYARLTGAQADAGKVAVAVDATLKGGA